ncbi:hypothetical protein Syun_031531 [Stephania yunnanensis]|uniref:Uncharacterized protein n=1 Tax=Stephania yunnanensis TaxID=152371 RepID=A0AAP0DW70_9MAGN
MEARLDQIKEELKKISTIKVPIGELRYEMRFMFRGLHQKLDKLLRHRGIESCGTREHQIEESCGTKAPDPLDPMAFELIRVVGDSNLMAIEVFPTVDASDLVKKQSPNLKSKANSEIQELVLRIEIELHSSTKFLSRSSYESPNLSKILTVSILDDASTYPRFVSMDEWFFEIDPPPWPPPCPFYLLPFLSLAICIFVLSGTRKFFETRARLEMILFREWHSQGAFMVGSLTTHKTQFWVSPWNIQSAQDCRAVMKTPSVNPAEHLVFTTMLIVFTTYTMEKVIEYVIFDLTIVLPHHFWTFIDHLHPITTSFFMTILLWSTSGGVFHVASNVFEEMSANLSSAISHSMKSFPLIFPIPSAGDLHHALFDFHYMGHTLFGQLVDSSLTLEWVSLLFILDDDMVQGEWGLACTVKTAAFSLVVLLYFWIDVTINMDWLSIRLINGVAVPSICLENIFESVWDVFYSYITRPPIGTTQFSSSATVLESFAQSVLRFYRKLLFEHTDLDKGLKGDSDYKWSIWLVVGLQMITLLVGALAIVCRGLALATQMHSLLLIGLKRLTFLQSLNAFLLTRINWNLYLKTLNRSRMIFQIFRIMENILDSSLFLTRIWVDSVNKLTLVAIRIVRDFFALTIEKTGIVDGLRLLKRRGVIDDLNDDDDKIILKLKKEFDDDGLSKYMSQIPNFYSEFLLRKSFMDMEMCIKKHSTYPMHSLLDFLGKETHDDSMKLLKQISKSSDKLLLLVCLVRMADSLAPSLRIVSLASALDQAFEIIVFIHEKTNAINASKAMNFFDQFPDAIFNGLNESVRAFEFQENVKTSMELVARFKDVDPLHYANHNIGSFMTTDSPVEENEAVAGHAISLGNVVIADDSLASSLRIVPLASALDQAFEIIVFIHAKTITKSGSNAMKINVAKDIWMNKSNSNHWFQTDIIDPLKRGCANHIRDCIAGLFDNYLPNFVICELYDIINIIGEPRVEAIRSTKGSVEELYDRIEQLFAELLLSFFDQLPNAIFNSLNERVAAVEFQKNAKIWMKVVARFTDVDPKHYANRNIGSFMTTVTPLKARPDRTG